MYGIDFGTTYTVVSYQKNENIQFIKFFDSILLPTAYSGVKNFKRIILEKSDNIDSLKQADLIEVLTDFFMNINYEIRKETKDESEYLNCVLTVPVRFNDIARYFIKYTAITAGFNVIKLIQEPVAAALSIIKKNNLVDGKYIVYDLGGGTFDASLLKKSTDIVQVLKVSGIENFGGIDIDEYIATLKNIPLNEAKKLKKTNYIKELDNILQKTYDIIDKITANEKIEGLILNGGSSYLENIINKYKDDFKIIKAENLQTLVSEGATLYGEDYLKKTLFLIDVTPFNLGIEVLGDKLEVIIGGNSPIPIKKTEYFVPVNNRVVINILQGSTLIASECKKLGSISLKTKEPFYVDFVLDCDGILTVKVLNQLFVLSDIFK